MARRTIPAHSVERQQALLEEALMDGEYALRKRAESLEETAELDHLDKEECMYFLRCAADNRRAAATLDYMLYNWV